MNISDEHRRQLDLLGAFAEDCHASGMSDHEVIRAAHRSGLIKPMRCPPCEGSGCEVCDGIGIVYTLGKGGST